MEELDLLKKNWNKTENFPKVSEEKIYAMLHKNSSSAVKWIFIISIIELSFGIVVGLIMSLTNKEDDNLNMIKEIGLYNSYQISTAIMYVIILYFIYQFYMNYKKVTTTDNVKKLMETILNTRKTVRNYIVFNLVFGAIFIGVFFSYGVINGIKKYAVDHHREVTITMNALGIVAVVIFVAIITLVLWLFYKLIYGFLLRRLKKNYSELEKIDYN